MCPILADDGDVLIVQRDRCVAVAVAEIDACGLAPLHASRVLPAWRCRAESTPSWQFQEEARCVIRRDRHGRWGESSSSVAMGAPHHERSGDGSGKAYTPSIDETLLWCNRHTQCRCLSRPHRNHSWSNCSGHRGTAEILIPSLSIRNVI